MSRIGKSPITVPASVTVDITKGKLVTVKGPMGTLQQQIDPDLGVSLEDGILTVSRPQDSKRLSAMHGLYRTLINNMVVGVTEGFKKDMEVIGVGYRAETSGQLLTLTLGYSHPIHFHIPKEVKVEAITEKGKAPVIKLMSHDKQLVGQVAAKIRELRKPEPYKGKGIKFVGEVLRRKAGKTAAKK